MSRTDPETDNIVMRRPHLDGLPEPRLPPGYALRPFRPGDEAAWADLMAAAFPAVEDPRGIPQREFFRYPQWQPQREFFVCAAERPVACAAAWERPEQWGPRTGQIHWVATHPDHLRRGLARAAVTAALGWMHPRYDNAVLVTQVYRLPAIRLYADLGFRPDLAAYPDMPARWARAEANLRAAGLPIL